MRHFVVIGAIDLVVLGLGILGAYHYSLAFLSFAVPAIGIITFFGTLQECERGNDERSIRRAITVATVTMYFVLVGVTAFFRGKDDMPEVAMSLLGTFTATVGVVVAFYFGSSAYVEAESRRANRE